MRRRTVCLFSLLVLFFLAVYTQRVALRDWWLEGRKSDVVEVSFEEVSEMIKDDGEEIKTGEQEDDLKIEGIEGVGEVEEVETIEDAVAEQSAGGTSDQLPVELNLAVPFTPQAPHGNWEMPYQEACEEASILMVMRYYLKDKSGLMDADEAAGEINRLIAFEEELLGFSEDTTAAQTAIILEQFAHLTPELLVNPTVQQIQAALSAGYPVIVPAFGQALDNPYYTPPGPLYHMLVIKGYTNEGEFITNDPGTRRGENYLYKFDTILNANHDWNGGDVELGERVMIIVKP